MSRYIYISFLLYDQHQNMCGGVVETKNTQILSFSLVQTQTFLCYSFTWSILYLVYSHYAYMRIVCMWYSISNRRRAPLAPLTTTNPPHMVVVCVGVLCIFTVGLRSACVCVFFKFYRTDTLLPEHTHTLTSMNQIRPSIIYVRLNACVCALVMRNVCAHSSYHQSKRTSIARFRDAGRNLLHTNIHT